MSLVSEFRFQAAYKAEGELEASKVDVSGLKVYLVVKVIFGNISYAKSCGFSFLIKDKKKKNSRNVLNVEDISMFGHNVIFCIKHGHSE